MCECILRLCTASWSDLGDADSGLCLTLAGLFGRLVGEGSDPRSLLVGLRISLILNDVNGLLGFRGGCNGTMVSLRRDSYLSAMKRSAAARSAAASLPGVDDVIIRKSHGGGRIRSIGSVICCRISRVNAVKITARTERSTKCKMRKNVTAVLIKTFGFKINYVTHYCKLRVSSFRSVFKKLVLFTSETAIVDIH